MTRKDYELIARAIRIYADADKSGEAAQQATTGHYKYIQSDTDKARQSRLQALALTLSDSLKQDNPNFNRDTFLKAAGL
jgi:hypothetical protein